SLGDHRDLRSFPTRRSSDLTPPNGTPRETHCPTSGRRRRDAPPSVLEHDGDGSFRLVGDELKAVDQHERVPAFVTGIPGGETKRSEEHTSELQSRENLVCRL